MKVNYLNHEAKVELHGTTADYQNIRNHYVNAGRCFGPVEVEAGEHVCVLGRQVVNHLEADEQIIGEHVSIQGQRFLVVGILESSSYSLG